MLAATIPTQKELKVPVPGMKSTPIYFDTPEWQVLYGGFWVSLCNYLLGVPEARAAFEEATGLSVEGLLRRSPLDAMIDKATGHERAVMVAWCDWVTLNLWGVAP